MKLSCLIFLTALLSGQLNAIELDLSGSEFVPEYYDASGPKDLFKAISDPVFETLQTAAGDGQLYYMKDESWLLVVTHGGVTRLYPVGLMNWHHIANETFAGDPVGVSYCPLTASSVVFSSRLPERKKTFAVAGSLYNANLVMYDQQTGSLWPQLDLRAYSGVEKGRNLSFLPVGWVTMSYARAHYADSPVLVGSVQYRSFLDKYQRLPGTNLETYPTRESVDSPLNPAALADKTYFSKELFIFFPESNTAFRFADAARFPDWVDAETGKGGIQRVLPVPGKVFITLYWFALKAFYPDAKVLK